MSLMLDQWPADEPPPPPPMKRRLWPWLAGVVGAVAVWVVGAVAVWTVPSGANSSGDPSLFAYSLAVFAIPTTLALLGVALLARTRLPGWALAVAHFVVLPLALLIPLGIAAVITGTGGADPSTDISFVYVIGCIWALTAVLICALLTTVRLLVRAARVRPEPSAAKLRVW